jgi:hypothetical protein
MWKLVKISKTKLSKDHRSVISVKVGGNHNSIPNLKFQLSQNIIFQKYSYKNRPTTT